MSPDVSDDVTSCESLSFTSLVCIKNQHLTPQRGHTCSLTHARKPSQEFEFSHAKYSAETMFSNSHLEPHANLFSSNQTISGEKNSSKCVIPSAQSKNSRADIAQSVGKPTRKATTKVRTRTDQNRTSETRTDQNRTSGRQGFGQRFFKSFTTPCKDCRTIEPMQGKLQQKIQNGH